MTQSLSEFIIFNQKCSLFHCLLPPLEVFPEQFSFRGSLVIIFTFGLPGSLEYAV